MWCSTSHARTFPMHQTGRRLSTHVKEHKRAVRRQDENSLHALRCLTTGHAFDWDRPSIIGKGTTKYTHDFIEAWNTTPICVNQCVTLNPGYRALSDCNGLTAYRNFGAPAASRWHRVDSRAHDLDVRVLRYCSRSLSRPCSR